MNQVGDNHSPVSPNGRNPIDISIHNLISVWILEILLAKIDILEYDGKQDPHVFLDWSVWRTILIGIEISHSRISWSSW